MVSLIFQLCIHYFNFLNQTALCNQGASSVNEIGTTASSTRQNSATNHTHGTSVTSSTEDLHSHACQCHSGAALGVLGALVGLLLVLLTVVSTALVWTCWNTKKSVRYTHTQISACVTCMEGTFKGEIKIQQWYIRILVLNLRNIIFLKKFLARQFPTFGNFM